MLPFLAIPVIAKTLSTTFLVVIGAKTTKNIVHEAIIYGKNKNNGGHDHRYNTGDDRTPAQKNGDKKRQKKGFFG